LLIDCHTHLWDVDRHLGRAFIEDYLRVWRGTPQSLRASPDEHLRAMRQVDRAVVLAFRSLAIGLNVPNDYVAEYVGQHPEKLTGFCSVDPNEEGASKELVRCVQDLNMSGVKLGPIYQHFDPTSGKAARVFEAAQDLDVPVLIHQGTTFVRDAPLRYAKPAMLDEVATRFPGLKMIVAHLGHPWEDETIALIRKQPNVYSDISSLASRPFRLYLKLLACIEYGVTDKLLFGSDFPFSTPELMMSVLKRINRFAAGSRLPRVPGEVIDKIMYENARQIIRL